MPDYTDQRLPGEIFERNVAALAPPPPLKLKGGIMSPDHYKSFIVNIRPTKWQQTFWIGKIDDFVNAQFIADLVYYYIGHPSFHLKNVDFKFPPLECMGTLIPLTSREMCFKYVTSIAKGLEFKIQRKEFRQSVKRLALEKVKSVEVQSVLQQFRDESGSAVIVGNKEEEGVQLDQPMEVDDPMQLPLVVASHEAVDQNVDGENAHVPGFDMSDSGFHLHSDLTPVASLWEDVYLADLENCLGSPNHDGENFWSVTTVLDTNSYDCSSALENFARNFFAMEDAAVDPNW